MRFNYYNLGDAKFKSALAPQFGMWSIPWIWLPVCFIAYFIPKGWQAILNLYAAKSICLCCTALDAGVLR